MGAHNAPLPKVNKPPTLATMNQTENEFVGVRITTPTRLTRSAHVNQTRLVFVGVRVSPT